jgi:hypothetical protein
MGILPEGHTYKKQMIDDDDNYIILYCWPPSNVKQVSETKPTYQTWLTEGNTPEVIPYVPPTPPAPQPNWDDFRDDLAGSRFYSLMLSTPIPAVLASQIVDALRTENITDLRTVAAPVAVMIELEAEDKIEVNDMAAARNIAWVFEVE